MHSNYSFKFIWDEPLKRGVIHITKGDRENSSLLTLVTFSCTIWNPYTSFQPVWPIQTRIVLCNEASPLLWTLEVSPYEPKKNHLVLKCYLVYVPILTQNASHQFRVCRVFCVIITSLFSVVCYHVITISLCTAIHAIPFLLKPKPVLRPLMPSSLTVYRWIFLSPPTVQEKRK